MSDMDDDVYLSDDEEGSETRKDAEESEKTTYEKSHVCPLTKETISEGLSLLCRTGKRLEHAFVKLDLKDKALTDIAAISTYIHIRFLDLSNNLVADLSPLATLNHLLWLKVDRNAVASFIGQPFAELTFLQWLSVAVNRLTDTDGLVGPSLETLILTGNSLQKLNGLQSSHFANLVVLELRGNHLETTDGINLPNLRRLYLAENFIKRLEGLENLERLTILHLRDNHLETLDGLSPNMKNLQYLNVRGNAVADEKALENLVHVSKTLKVLVLSGNPLVEILDYRPSVLILSPQLERIDKEPVTLEERMEARRAIRELNEEEIPVP
ncbi:leucine-rich repeat-containing protein 23 isoform X1 [Fundulus heteroclitus]|uniref:leucine-rich repeat-containing protein 23 isoform X1 n=1 Tax=Fundulus heteroclitus TaxID=8078 RepID=UPI00165AB2AC|nr:leucine-rich repeat-containing protein 23 isoform X1 [Fundulus heteroclitus]